MGLTKTVICVCIRTLPEVPLLIPLFEGFKISSHYVTTLQTLITITTYLYSLLEKKYKRMAEVLALPAFPAFPALPAFVDKTLNSSEV